MSRTYSQILNSVYSTYFSVRCRNNSTETPEQSKLSLDAKISHLMIPHMNELLNGSLSKHLMIKIIAEAVYDESPDMALFLKLLYIPIEDAKTEEHSNIQSSQVLQKSNNKSTSKVAIRNSSADKLDKLVRDQNRDLLLSNRSVRQVKQSLRNNYVLQKGVSSLLVKLLTQHRSDAKLLYKHACEVENCDRCAQLFNSAPITECKSIHGGEKCNELALYPHVTKLVHDGKNLSPVTSCKSWLNPLAKSYKTSENNQNMIIDTNTTEVETPSVAGKQTKRKLATIPLDYKEAQSSRKRERYEMYTLNVRDPNFPHLLELARKECIRLKRKGLTPLTSSSLAFRLVYHNPAISLMALKSDIHAHANTASMSRNDKCRLRKKLKLNA